MAKRNISRADLREGAPLPVAGTVQSEAQPVTALAVCGPESSWSPEAEISVLGAVLMDQRMLPDVELVLGTDDFYSDRSRTIWQAMLAMVDARQPLDPVLLFQRLRDTGRLEQAGGPEYIARLTEAVPTPVNAVHYARLVRDQAVRRRAEVLLHGALQRIQAAQPGQAIEEVHATQAALYSAVERCGCDDAPMQVRDGLRGFFSALEERMRGKCKIAGISTGFMDIDSITSGVQPGQLVILAARPGMGKSSLAKDFAIAAARAGEPAVIFPVEDGRERCVARCMAAMSGVAAERIRSGQVDDAQFEELFQAGDLLSRLPLWIDDSPRLSTTDVRRRLMGLRRVVPVRLAVVDYVQKMASVRHYDSREREVSETVGELKAIGRETGCVMVVLAQLNRKLEERANKRPLLADLRESGALEQDADLVAFIYRDEVYDPDSKDRGIAEVIIAKGRDCGLGTARLRWDPCCVRFQNLAREGQGQ